jgi:hypothetical protein
MVAEALAATVRSICAIDADDAMRFDAATVSVQEIREEANYGGLLREAASKAGQR